jgi:hypothetical protein
MNRPVTRALVVFGVVSAAIWIIKPIQLWDPIRKRFKPACNDAEPEVRLIEGLGKAQSTCTAVPWYMISAGASGLALLFS